ncbi:TetR family transcriptional regulator [Nocardioides sp. MAH-18]|uniref:TetR family transcriptional regulator n=1 Tax=Nocardioides agri TaxID=2682843 RepID=A0A6L6XN80_9ACTN|nr:MULTISPECIES: TetR/AcrR family transcriptional regulator [unclassified Nocardioides]MBA2953809.1 TetR/AcrR family transcriptional regulator [Nocardioides sp. CGMCC 1.13656]MVQ48674.1 TetR family transcriptional regulator [Nocardioides sp. MAH-18]
MTTTGTETIDWRNCQPVELTDILRHSSEAFYEHGFHGTTVRDIAARVGVTVPALYYHHENKEAILVAVLGAAIADLQVRGEAAIADAGDDPVQQMANLVESVTLHLTVRARLAALDSEYRYLSADARMPYAEVRKANELLTRSVIDRGVEAGVFHVDDTAEATRALLGMLQAIPRWYVDSGPLTPADVATRYVGLSLALLGATPRKD